jgi:leukotriene-A4 hydrolase
LLDSCEALGAQLKISLPGGGGVAASYKLIISYETSPDSMAIGWLPPEQTAGKGHPYMFTQCQAIHARGLVPCQDSPGVKYTYTATLLVPAELTALMSAVRSAEPTDATDGSGRKLFHFSQPVPMSSYLIAIACGNLTSIRVGPRTEVWSEPEMVEAGAFEFADTEQFVAIGEQICGPYEWGVYDILLLPPSFPCEC